MGGRHKSGKIMMNNEMKVRVLRYQIARYQAMGNGAMCQKLKAQLKKVEATQSVAD